MRAGGYSPSGGTIPSSASSGMPIGATKYRPASRRAAGSSAKPALARWKVTVRSAATTGSDWVPSVRSTSVGVSTASTRHGRPAARAWVTMAFSRSTALEIGSRKGPAAPLPSSASIRRLAGERRARSWRSSSGVGATKRARDPAEAIACSTAQLCAAAVPLIRAGSPTRTAVTCRPAAASRRAATKPSPPLLPGPHSTTVTGGGASGPPGPVAGSAMLVSSASASSTTAAPALSISASGERPRPCAASSMRRISSPPMRTVTSRAGRAAGSVTAGSSGSRRRSRSRQR